MEPRNPDREVKWPNKIKQSKTCQGQDRPRGASQPNKRSRYSLNLFHWFADRGSLAPRKKTIHSGHRSPSVRCILKHLIKHLRLDESYYNHNSINLIHHLYITGLYIWLCCHIIFTHTHTLSWKALKKVPIYKISRITYIQERASWHIIFNDRWLDKELKVSHKALRN